MKQMNRRDFLKATAAASLGLTSSFASSALSIDAENRPNVLYIMCDDLNHYVTDMGGHPQGKTPNINRLMEMGVSFMNAHSNHPVCLPSRTSLFSGLYPHTTGALGWEGWDDSDILKGSVSMFQHFKKNGYNLFGTGKLYHSARRHKKVWQDENGTSNFAGNTAYGPVPWDGKSKGWLMHPTMKDMEKLITEYQQKIWRDRGEHTFGPLSDIPEYKGDKEKNIPGYKGWTLAGGKPFRYINDDDRDLMPDELSANFAVEVLNKKHDKPFFLGVGFIRPHTPMYVPKKYFDMFPLDEIKLPPYKEDDLDDCEEFKHLVFKYGFQRHELYMKYGGVEMWKRCVQAYLACVAFADEQLGKVLDALEKSPHANDTIIVFTSDHGFHMGEKNYNFKLTNWEVSTRVPFIVAGSGIARKGTKCHHPVSLLDIYPSLIDLCNLPENPNAGLNNQPLDGHSIKPFLLDPANGKWEGPPVALTAIYSQDETNGQVYHYSVRSENWRYTLYSNDAEELYDHRSDPHEWHNLAKDENYNQVKTKLRQQLLGLLGDDIDKKRGIKS
ncbi:MAG: sulfatase [Planctomycetota bacterium]|jgi:arylsulfatase A-like enzyme